MSQDNDAVVTRVERDQFRLILRVGFVCLGVWLGALLAIGAVWPKPFAESWKLVLGQMMAGRAFSVSEGIELGFPWAFLLFQVALQDIIILLLLYQLLIAGYRKLTHVRFVGPLITGIHASAERHKNRVEPFGAIGIAAFVLFPFWSTGPLAGSVIGYMLGIRTWLVFVSVIVGNFLSVGCWIVFFAVLHGSLERIGAKLPCSLPLLVLLSVVGLAVVGHLWSRGKQLLTPACRRATFEAEPAADSQD